MSFIASSLWAIVILVLCVSSAFFIVSPLIRRALIAGFESLDGKAGTAAFARRSLSYPLVAMLSRERKAARGDGDAAISLFLLNLAVGMMLSTLVQGFLTTLAVTGFIFALFAIGAYLFD